jgi:hypothetical protein
VSGHLSDDKLETLRGWGVGLAADGRDELRAAGKAILILVEEIERLQVQVWHAKDRSSEQDQPDIAPEQSEEAVAVEAPFVAAQPLPELDATLSGRIRRLLRRRALDSTEPGLSTASAQSGESSPPL